MTIGLNHCLLLAAMLFAIGLYGVLSKRNIIAVLMGVELMLNAVNINFVAFNRFTPVSDLTGQLCHYCRCGRGGYWCGIGVSDLQ